MTSMNSTSVRMQHQHMAGNGPIPMRPPPPGGSGAMMPHSQPPPYEGFNGGKKCPFRALKQHNASLTDGMPHGYDCEPLTNLDSKVPTSKFNYYPTSTAPSTSVHFPTVQSFDTQFTSASTTEPSIIDSLDFNALNGEECYVLMTFSSRSLQTPMS